MSSDEEDAAILRIVNLAKPKKQRSVLFQKGHPEWQNRNVCGRSHIAM